MPDFRLQSAIANLHSPVLPCGGIAQLVERQLCKLDVRGSNPLASMFFRDRPLRGRCERCRRRMICHRGTATIGRSDDCSIHLRYLAYSRVRFDEAHRPPHQGRGGAHPSGKQKCRTQIVSNPHSAFLVSNQTKTELCVTVSEFFKPRRFSLSRSSRPLRSSEELRS